MNNEELKQLKEEMKTCEICGLADSPETMEFSLASKVWLHPDCQADMEMGKFGQSTPVGLRLACTKCGELTLDRGQDQSLCGNCV